MKHLLIIAVLTVLGTAIIPERVEPTDSKPSLALKQVTVPETKSITLADTTALVEVANIKAPEPVMSHPAAAASSGSCADWIASAGVDDVASAMTLINRESGCNASVVNPSSGSCGVAQELPCGKSGCSLGDGACQVRWMSSYVLGRYGSWAAALAHSFANNWY